MIDDARCQATERIGAGPCDGWVGRQRRFRSQGLAPIQQAGSRRSSKPLARPRRSEVHAALAKFGKGEYRVLAGVRSVAQTLSMARRTTIEARPRVGAVEEPASLKVCRPYGGYSGYDRTLRSFVRHLDAAGIRPPGASGSTSRAAGARRSSNSMMWAAGPGRRSSGPGDQDASSCTWTAGHVPPAQRRRPAPAPCSASTAGAGASQRRKTSTAISRSSRASPPPGPPPWCDAGTPIRSASCAHGTMCLCSLRVRHPPRPPRPVRAWSSASWAERTSVVIVEQAVA